MFFYNIYLWSRFILRGIFLLKVSFSNLISFSMHAHNWKPSVILTTIVWTPPPSSLEVGYEKLKKGWKYGAETGLLKKRGGWHFSYLIFWRFIIFLHSEITLPFAKLCHTFEEKIFFFCHHNFMKKGHS